MTSKIRIIAGTILMVSLLFPAMNAMAVEPPQLSIVADTAIVNKTGGLTVSGTMSCAEAVASYDWSSFGGSMGQPPDNLSVLVNINWDAYQPIGRKTMLQASYASSYKDTCFNTNQTWGLGPCSTDVAAPCRWITSNYGSTSVPSYVYSPSGKFGPGELHVDVSSDRENPDGWIVINGEFICGLEGSPPVPVGCSGAENEAPMTLNLYQFSGYDLKATRLR